jgi:hypothetical protein
MKLLIIFIFLDIFCICKAVMQGPYWGWFIVAAVFLTLASSIRMIDIDHKQKEFERKHRKW